MDWRFLNDISDHEYFIIERDFPANIRSNSTKHLKTIPLNVIAAWEDKAINDKLIMHIAVIVNINDPDSHSNNIEKYFLDRDGINDFMSLIVEAKHIPEHSNRSANKVIKLNETKLISFTLLNRYNLYASLIDLEKKESDDKKEIGIVICPDINTNAVKIVNFGSNNERSMDISRISPLDRLNIIDINGYGIDHFLTSTGSLKAFQRTVINKTLINPSDILGEDEEPMASNYEVSNSSFLSMTLALHKNYNKKGPNDRVNLGLVLHETASNNSGKMNKKSYILPAFSLYNSPSYRIQDPDGSYIVYTASNATVAFIHDCETPFEEY